MQNELIIVSEYCSKCHIEPSFIDMLQEGGLIDIQMENGERYLLFSELPNVERYSRMYYDLSINMEGIDAIHHLLERMETMQKEIHSLHNRLKFFGAFD
ncbi:chaperone modulator CbpM [uncultured Bacteroides sp.]|uniref:chaperone modulator CbpM n=1 Tax=uncultured Bacteroides sp. TaxID=162156 RepID=UPI0025E8B69B|nr:chaperone modulator CbpM [uncultured Bacteroides sp.]